ncbi:CG15485 [Drosophila busckii]|uniref:CG15485 n=1 Tax=Drosophila busckii TaxID=30019 RepID=A0A0M4E8N3_DROBS|nr:CG15485 [Drosophila busckii]
MQQQIDEQVQEFLQNATAANEASGSAEAKAKQFYASCVQMKTNMSQGYELLMGQQADRLAGSNETVDWLYVNFMSNYELYPLLPLKVHYNTASRKFALLLTPPVKTLAQLNEQQLQNLTTDLQLNATQKAQLTLLTAFERNLTSLVKQRNETQQLTLAEFLTQQQHARLNWTRYFHLAFNGSEQGQWLLFNQLDELGELLAFLESVELPLLRSYVQHRELLKFYALWQTETRNGSLASACRSLTESYYNYALLPWFIARTFGQEQRADVLQVARNIRGTFYELLAQYSWLDDETRSHARTKLAAMDIDVGYSDELTHRALIDKVYSDFNMSTNWFVNLATLERSRARIRLKSVDRALVPLLMPTRSVNAYYADFLNQAFITIAMTQFPLYHLNFPPVLKYAGIGNIIGHEMAHGFDSYCYQYNYDGKKLNWWSAASLRNFKQRYRCLESQYNKYILLGVPTNGSLTSGDNIADNVGARMAYYAYKQYAGNSALTQQPLRGIDLNNKQLFFLKFAQTWCTGKDAASQLSKLKSDPHAYEEFRVIGTLSNMPEFSEAYNCKLGTDMNPIKKCVVW